MSQNVSLEVTPLTKYARKEIAYSVHKGGACDEVYDRSTNGVSEVNCLLDTFYKKCERK